VNRGQIMKFYVDIKLIPNEEDNLGFLWNRVYTQMHLALVGVKDENVNIGIGFSFPHYNNHDFPLGDTLRVFAESKEKLEELKIHKWLNRLDGYIYVGATKELPSDIKGYVHFARKQFKTNPERLARRQAKRKGISLKEALKNYEGMTEQTTKLPFVMMKSSGGQYMKIFIEKSISDEEVKGSFSTYGLSKTATVPWF